MYFNFLAGRVICAPTCGKSSAAVHPRSHTTFSENAAFQWRRTVQRFAVKDHLVMCIFKKLGQLCMSGSLGQGQGHWSEKAYLYIIDREFEFYEFFFILKI